MKKVLDVMQDLRLKIDFQMYADNFLRSEISDEESIYFINLEGNLYCIVTKIDKVQTQSLKIPSFEQVPHDSLIKNVKNLLLEKTKWRYTTQTT